MKREYPILEFDPCTEAIINPWSVWSMGETPFDTNKMIITFFKEALDRLIEEKEVIFDRTIRGENPIDVYKFKDSDILISLGQVGCPACAGNLDLFNEMGINKVMFCGGGGVLDKEIRVGQLLLVEGAIRDEGFSYHYIEPSRYIYTDPVITDRIATYLNDNGISFTRGLTWTTDAIFRETADRIKQRKIEGAKIVEMEQAGCIAVAQFRGFDYGALIYGGDDVSGDVWDNRGWRSRGSIRYNLILLCRKLVDMI